MSGVDRERFITQLREAEARQLFADLDKEEDEENE